MEIGILALQVVLDPALFNRHTCILNYCEKSFEYKSHLVMHKIIYTGDKPFSCKICAKSFTQKSTLRTHMFMIHGIKKSNLRTHMITQLRVI